MKAGIRLCAKCDKDKPDRIEVVLRPLIQDAVGFPASSIDDVMIGGATCDTHKRRPDFSWVSEDRVIFGEIDENGGHPDRESSCELAKMWDQMIAVQKAMGTHIRVFYVRLNPDAYDGGDVSIDHRVEEFGNMVKILLTAELTDYNPAIPHVKYLYYHSKCQFHIDAALASPDSMAVL